MPTQLTAEVTCSACGTVLHLRYTLVPNHLRRGPPLGCPECQATEDVQATMEQLGHQAAPKILRVSALEKRKEIGLGSQRDPTPAMAPQPHMAGAAP